MDHTKHSCASKTQRPLCQQCVPSMRKGRESISVQSRAGCFYAPSSSVWHTARTGLPPCDTSDTWSALSPPNAPLSRVICCFHSEAHPRPPGISCATVAPGLSLLQQRGSDHTAAAASRMETTRGLCDPTTAASFLRLSFWSTQTFRETWSCYSWRYSPRV